MRNFYIPIDIKIVDWWLYTILLLNGASGTYINNTITFYRQTDKNITGYKQIFNEKDLIFGVSVKMKHYSNILEYCKKYHFQSALLDYSSKKNNLLKLKDKFKSKLFKERYLKVINQNVSRIYKGWWSYIISLEEYYKYEKN